MQRLDGDWTPLRALVERLSGEDSSIDAASGALLVSHRPRVAPEAYACVLFPSVDSGFIDRYERIQRSRDPQYVDIPVLYRNLLQRINGGSFFELHLCGAMPSMAQEPPLIDRSVRQPFDLSLANENALVEYEVPPPAFFFGVCSYSFDENVGYFLTPDDRIEAYLSGRRKIAEWADMQDFLVDELRRAESTFPEFEKMMEKIMADTNLSLRAKGRDLLMKLLDAALGFVLARSRGPNGWKGEK